MATKIFSLALLLTSTAYGWGPGGGGGGGGYNNPYDNGGNDDNDRGFNSAFFRSFFTSGQKILTAHAVLAALAFVVLFPTGGILIRVASFPGLWIAHGLFQIFAYVVYIAAFGLGIYMATNLHMMDETHVIIGIVLFVLLFFQPFLGLLHHIGFKKHARRGVWSYGHIWLGRGLITLGIVNGGLGLKLAKDTHIGAPTNGQVVAYSVVAAIMWAIYMLAAMWGELKRGRDRRADLEKTAVSSENGARSRSSGKRSGRSIYR